MSGIMVVGVGVDLYALAGNFPAVFYPDLHLFGAIHDRFIPHLCVLLDAFAVAKPADIREISGDGIEFRKPLVDGRHPCLVDEGQSDIIFSQKVNERGNQPGFISDFQGKLFFLWKLIDERFQPVQEFGHRIEFSFIEVRKLQEHGAELLSQVVGDLQETLKILFAIE